MPLTIALLGPFDLAIVLALIIFCTFVLVRGQRSVHLKLGSIETTIGTIDKAVNNVAPDEPKLIDRVRAIASTQESMLVAQNNLARIGHANHVAVVSVETTVLGFGERLTAIGMKANSAFGRAEEAQRIVTDYVHEQNIIDDAVRRGLLDRRVLNPKPEQED